MYGVEIVQFKSFTLYVLFEFIRSGIIQLKQVLYARYRKQAYREVIRRFFRIFARTHGSIVVKLADDLRRKLQIFVLASGIFL